MDDENNFSEDEEAAFVNAHAHATTTDTTTDIGLSLQNLTLSNVAPFQDRHRHHRPSQQQQKHYQPYDDTRGPSRPLPPKKDNRIRPQRHLILFDLNGVLVHHKYNNRTHTHTLRPFLDHLLRLVRHFQLGIYSSATLPTVQKALDKINTHLHAARTRPPPPPHRLRPAPPAGLPQHQHQNKSFFDFILCRDHCTPVVSMGLFRKGGKPWDTFKPLDRHFASLDKVILVDDSRHKAVPHEVGNMLVMPAWEGGSEDRALVALVEGLNGALDRGLHRAADIVRAVMQMEPFASVFVETPVFVEKKTSGARQGALVAKEPREVEVEVLELAVGYG